MAKKVKLTWIGCEKLVTLKRNPQYLTPAQMDALKASIARDGFCAPILVRPLSKDRYEVVSGNHRLMAAQELKHATVPCVVAKMTNPDAQRLAINLNTIHGEPNAEILAPYLVEMDKDVLAEVYVDSKMKTDLLKFDRELKATIEKMRLPDALSRDSSQSRIALDCTCPVCGRRHVAANGENKTENSDNGV